MSASSNNEAREGGNTGNVESAPMSPRIWLKAGVSTVIAAILTVVVYLIIDSGVISFRP